MKKPKKLVIPYKVGDKLKIELDDNRGIKRGRVIDRTSHNILVKFKNYKESFNIAQLLNTKVVRV
ncbi:hypothetical protein [Clostridium sp. UBA2485]|uniref:hypothetical protein n=1 Tax=Clostridium sp. UBA2485 TaxID=1946352 RepID=UPI0025C61F68|nr:hypothetical protein [Clostridium sp. UBA2485]